MIPDSKPLVSIVITCYNYGHYLESCIKSVLDQTYQNFEVILVDDGSTDNTRNIVEPFLDDSRINFIQQNNCGQANAKNRGIKQSRGAYIAFLDADDMWHSEKLAKQIPLFADPKVAVVFSRAMYIDEYGNDLNLEITSFNKYIQPKEGRVLKHLLFDNFIPFSSAVVRRELIKDGFNEKIKMGIDWELWLKLSINHEFREVPEKLLLYRMGHPGQMSKNMIERFRSTDTILDRFITDQKHRIRKTWIDAALAYKYCFRAEYYSKYNSSQAVALYLKAIYNKPIFIPAWKGIVKMILRFVVPNTSKEIS